MKKLNPRVAYTIVLETPEPPQFLFVEGLEIVGTETARVSIADVPDGELRKLGKKWTDALVERAAGLRKSRSPKSNVPGRPT